MPGGFSFTPGTPQGKDSKCLTSDRRGGIILVTNQEGEMPMTTDTKPSRDEAVEFFLSTRGQYIMAQALYYAVKALESVEPAVMRENSNIEDMRFLQENLFNFPAILFDAESQKETLANLAQAENNEETAYAK